MRKFQLLTLAVALATLFRPEALWSAEQKPPTFRVTYASDVSKEPFTGRVFLILSSTRLVEPPREPNWFNPAPFFAQDVKSWKAGQTLTFNDGCMSYPCSLSQLKNGNYWAMAVMDLDQGGRSFGASEGNGFSNPFAFKIDPAEQNSYSIIIDQIFHETRFRETDRVKLVEVESKLLTAFFRRPVSMRAAVVLPRSFAENLGRHYPAVYEIPGFGGTHVSAFPAASRDATNVAGTEMLYTVLDPSCRLGHHVFADSENNGPRGRALVEELIPEIERRFRAIGSARARYLTGHSSGGWSSLWLQITYPEFFGGVWSTSPDPVDFRDFQRINIYAPGVNMFRDASGNSRPLARRNDMPVLLYKPFSDMELVMGHGGQLGSFEAVFSPRGADGQPRQLWNRATGQVDSEVAKCWERYDIRLKLERNWPGLGPKLAGKLHVFTGGLDTFYLEGAVELLKQSLARLGSDAVIEVIPGRNHGNLLSSSLRERVAQEMAAKAR